MEITTRTCTRSIGQFVFPEVDPKERLLTTIVSLSRSAFASASSCELYPHDLIAIHWSVPGTHGWFEDTLAPDCTDGSVRSLGCVGTSRPVTILNLSRKQYVICHLLGSRIQYSFVVLISYARTELVEDGTHPVGLVGVRRVGVLSWRELDDMVQ
jgi:hypothetical protein